MKLTNVVVQGDLGCKIDLRELTYKLTIPGNFRLASGNIEK